jgi:tetratricopeptide (TPR) repeat protein
MSWWSNLISGRSGASEDKPDYYQEGLDLLKQDKLHEALTSFRLALRENPKDTDVMQQIAVTYTLVGQADESVRTYRRVLELEPHASGAHYGLAFLLLQRGETDEAISHLRAFLARPPELSEAARHIAHARATLAELTGEPIPDQGAASETPPPA